MMKLKINRNSFLKQEKYAKNQRGFKMKTSLIAFLLVVGFVGTAHAFDASLPFHVGTTISVSVTNSASSAAAIPIASNPSWQILVQNTGANLAFCKLGGSTITATTTDFPVPAGIIETLTIDQDSKFISCITASSTTTVYVTGGVGH